MSDVEGWDNSRTKHIINNSKPSDESPNLLTRAERYGWYRMWRTRETTIEMSAVSAVRIGDVKRSTPRTMPSFRNEITSSHK